MLEILIVDDDGALVEMLREYLQAENFTLHHAQNGDEALSRIETKSFDFVILDVMMPGLDGFEVLARLRRHSEVPVLMLTARGGDDDRVAGLELGADDNLAKPFNPRELVARIRAILRRREPAGAARRQALRVGPLRLDPESLTVSLEDREIRLTGAEFFVLEALARRAGQIQPRAVLTEQALGRSLEPYDRSIDTHVANIRRKLGLSDTTGISIRGVRGQGYILGCTVSR
jgi:two-component system response regulator CpxR